MNEYLAIYSVGVASGVGASVWFCQQLARFRGPGYYRRRARRVRHGFAR